MKSKKIFELDKEQRDFLQKVSSYCGLDRASTQVVWEFTIFTMLMEIAENPDCSYNVLQIPYLGKILFKESRENPNEYDMFLSLNDNIKDLAKKAKKGNLQDLISYFSEKFIKSSIKELEESEWLDAIENLP